ncbi:cellulose binding domain-containing protein [Streptomonospora sp. PA3]|uniref:cellulose binding domain-containing protein n=1 Tax=Streptomonospora sp. PA3 TaxID=2607326 RepID=UPI0016428E3B|nr:cellulose binding domain-containing protein [Streptomonospora sp. PA3]
MLTRIRAAVALGASATVLATTAVLLTWAPASAQAAETITNVAYAPAQPADSRGHLLDLYLPEGGQDRPLVIWSSGSAWMSDDGKSGADAIADALNPKGYAVAGVSVRSSSQAQFPAQVHDIKAAIRFLRANADQYRLDPDRFAVMGTSSGGWVASMAGTTGGVAELEGDLGTTGVSSSVQASVPFFGPSDFLQLNAQSPPSGGIDHDAPDAPASRLMGCAIQTCPDKVAKANPITYVDGGDPPMLLLHGQSDNIVPHGQSTILYNAVRDACGDARFISVPDAGHSRTDVMSSAHFGTQTVRTAADCQETVTTGTPDPTWDTIDAFLRRALDLGGTPDPDPTPSPSPSDPPEGDTACEIAYTANTWNNGFTAAVTITNTGPTPIDGWSLSWTWPGDQRVTNAWNATVSQSGAEVTAGNVGYNGTIAPEASADFGFQATHSGSNPPPTEFALNGSSCTTG